MENTLVILKPDVLERKLMGEIISIYEKTNLHISQIKIIKPTVQLATKHYIEHIEKPFFNELLNYITRGEVCAMIIEGDDAISKVRQINGATDPKKAELSSIRGMYGISKTENSVHSSDSKESANKEIDIWFK